MLTIASYYDGKIYNISTNGENTVAQLPKSGSICAV
jgi:hypothetical protein